MIPSLFSSFTSTSTRASRAIANGNGNSNNIIARFYHHKSSGGFQQQYPYRWGHSRMMHDAMMPPSSGHPHHPHHLPYSSEYYLQRGGPFHHYYRAMHAKRFMRTAFIVGVSLWIGYAWGKRNEKKSMKKKHNHHHYDRKHEHDGGTTTTTVSSTQSPGTDE
eukprot:TRINITY_DN13012_c0_g1_i1.p1 TRINITY_DN13012_c0_g1~~TRINITY_DN13012_c0_g1_i1.p1  ORF type:complete len:162 (-),score=31.63 TRINITY_DN13012_c0_g1_i1:165-650(-)